MEVRGVKALHIWIKRVISSYTNITILDFSSSFRSGLVFCAIIHHFRPGLIDYDNLSAENVYFNNSLAFNVAESMLNIPSLLDPQVFFFCFMNVQCVHIHLYIILFSCEGTALEVLMSVCLSVFKLKL